MADSSTTTHRGAQHQGETSSAAPATSESPASHAATHFVGHGAIPAVAASSTSPAPTSASDRAYGALDTKLPAGVDVTSVRASVMIPGKRKLAGGYWHGGTVRTKTPSELSVEVTHTGIRVGVEPGLYLDADWPLQDCEIRGAGLDFASKQPWADVADVPGFGTGMFSIAGNVAGKLTEMIRKATAGTKLVSGHYDPAKDADVRQTLDEVLAGFMRLFAENDPKHEAAEHHPPVTPQQMTHLSAGATIVVRDGASFAKEGSGFTLAANGALSIQVDGAGSLAGAAGAHDPQAMADAVNVQAVHLSTEALQVIVKGKPIAKIEGLTLQRGGKITIDRMTPLGKVAGAEAMESGLSLLAALVALHEHDAAANELYRNAQQPQIVDGVTRRLIEDGLRDALHGLVATYRNVVPGVDLARALGLG